MNEVDVGPNLRLMDWTFEENDCLKLLKFRLTDYGASRGVKKKRKLSLALLVKVDFH